MAHPRWSEQVVVTGLGAVSPFGFGLAPFIAGLRRGESATTLLPPELARELSPSGVRVAARAPDPVGAGLWSVRDAERLPRLVPLAVLAAREAIQNAHLSAALADEQTAQRVGLVLGTGGGGIDFTLEQARTVSQGKRQSLWTITNATHGNLAGELSIALGLRGPSQCVSTGCASSSDAIGRALELLRLSSVIDQTQGPRAPGVLDAVVVVGADAHVEPDVLSSMQLLGVVSTRRCETPAEAAAACRPFDARRDGFVLGEGAWALVLERASVRPERTPLAAVVGYAATCDAFHRVRPDPGMGECVRAMQWAIADAGLEPTDIELIQYHGTGTAVNDSLETVAVRAAFGKHVERLKGSSIKGAIGHPQGACGAASTVAMIGSLRGLDAPDAMPFCPPTINLHEPDPACTLDYTPNDAAPTEARTVLVNCLAFGAKNSAIVLRVFPRG